MKECRVEHFAGYKAECQIKAECRHRLRINFIIKQLFIDKRATIDFSRDANHSFGGKNRKEDKIKNDNIAQRDNMNHMKGDNPTQIRDNNAQAK